jgi:hypothetical protein
MVSQDTLLLLHEKYQALVSFMDERVLRRWAAAEARALGWGGASAVAKATGISRTTRKSSRGNPNVAAIRPPDTGLVESDRMAGDGYGIGISPAAIGIEIAPTTAA